MNIGDKKCEECENDCATCPNAKDECTSCTGILFLLGDECVDNCGDGLYGNVADNTCKTCDPRCATCNGPSTTSCQSCNNVSLTVYYHQVES
jgi:proprotein convertase subtilisin/kexin type 5